MGINTGGGTETADRLLDSTLESVDSAEAWATEIAQKAGVSEDDLAKISMAVRESMVNAVVHGNQYSAHKKVRVSLSRSAGRFTITIADEGNGFDPDTVPDPLATENLMRSSGRGIFLIRAFMDEFQARRLDPGMEVTMVKYLDPA
jgi:serine/threonine-protein kinase RsbW